PRPTCDPDPSLHDPLPNLTAVKLGAADYLAKPADADDIFAALTRPPGEKAPPPENPMSADRVRWEHIQRVYEMCDRNVSETARRDRKSTRLNSSHVTISYA